MTIATPGGVVTGIGKAAPQNDNGEKVNDNAMEWCSFDGRCVVTTQRVHIYVHGEESGLLMHDS
jgi:hypothetical protein